MHEQAIGINESDATAAHGVQGNSGLSPGILGGGFLMFRWQLKDEGELARSKASMDVFWRERTEVEGV